MDNREIDTGRVIEEVRLRKCLWDTTDLLYRNKDARNKAWDDIVVALFGNVSSEEKQHLGKSVQQRWKTARDAFFRSKSVMKNTPSGSSAKKFKKYVFFDELTFLIPLTQNEVDESLHESVLSPQENSQNTESISDKNISSAVNNDVLLSSSNASQSPQGEALPENTWATKRRNKHRQTSQESSEFEKGLLNLLASQTADLASDDLSFFSSLGPILKTFDFEQKLEFRSRVLQIVTAVKNMHYRPSSSTSTINLTSPDVRSPPQYELQNTYNTPSPYNYEYETATSGHPGYLTAGTSSYTDNDHRGGSSENI